MDFSIFLAKCFGLYFIIVSLAVLINVDSFKTTINNLLQNRATHLVLSFHILIVGILLVVSHNIWIWDWPVVITVLAWVVLLKGIINLWFPKFAVNLAQPFIYAQSNLIYFSMLVNLLLGILLAYFGFINSTL